MRRCHIDGQESTDVLEMTDKPATREQPDHAPSPASTGLDDGARRQLLDQPIIVDVSPGSLSTPDLATRNLFSTEQPSAVTRRLMPLSAEPESFLKQSVFLALALAIACGYFYFTQKFWAPAHWGNNQNGYLVGGKLLAQSAQSKGILHANTGFEPRTPYNFVGWMWLMADENSAAPGGGVHYPKYPIGVPLLDAILYRIGHRIGGIESAIDWAYRVSPICMSLALLGAFLVTRAIAGSFAGIMAMMLMGTNSVVLLFTNNPNSHGASLCFLTLGVWMLVRWWQTAAVLRGLLAGLLLGCAVTTRYTEGLMILPLAIAVLLMIVYRRGRDISWWRAAVWCLSAALAFALVDSIGAKSFQWQANLNTFTGDHVRWWQRALVVLIPLLITIRWTRIRESIDRESILAGNWMRLLGCAVLVLVATFVHVGQLADKTPKFLHAMRFVGLAGALVLGILMLWTIQWKRLRTWLPAVVPAVGWLVPVVAMVVYNRITLGTWTGYDSTNESSGFTWPMFVSKWRYAVDQLYDTGLYALMPLGIAGLALAFRWNWRAALVLALWFVPGTLLYMSYYYGMGMPMIGYLRFFTSMLPAAIISAAWLLHRATMAPAVIEHGAVAGTNGDAVHRAKAPWRMRGSIAAPITVGAFVALAAAANLAGTLGPLERDYVLMQNLADVGKRIREAIPCGDPARADSLAVVFGPSQKLLNYLQFAGEYDLYGSDYFRNGFPVPSMGSNDPNQPNPIQPARKKFLNKVYQDRDNADMIKVQNQIMTGALNAGRRVFVVQPSAEMGAFRRTYLASKQFETTIVRKWTEPARMSSDAVKALVGLGSDGSGRSVPQSWQILEVKLAPPAPASQPASAPASLPAAEPAQASTVPTTAPMR
jgi:hypothetical protein